MPVADVMGGSGMVAAVGFISGGLAAVGYLLCLAAPLGGQVRLIAGLAAVSFTAAAVMAFTMAFEAPISPDSPHYAALQALLGFTFLFTLGLVVGVYESC